MWERIKETTINISLLHCTVFYILSSEQKFCFICSCVIHSAAVTAAITVHEVMNPQS